MIFLNLSKEPPVQYQNLGQYIYFLVSLFHLLRLSSVFLVDAGYIRVRHFRVKKRGFGLSSLRNFFYPNASLSGLYYLLFSWISQLFLLVLISCIISLLCFNSLILKGF